MKYEFVLHINIFQVRIPIILVVITYACDTISQNVNNINNNNKTSTITIIISTKWDL